MRALDQATSPYLKLHKDNPVQWRLWGAEALAEAAAQNKPIFLSIGYTGCHWCHAMNQESFSHNETAEILNRDFIPVLVDRDERPDIDQIYQGAANVMGHIGGWPLSFFLTPDALPFFVSGYSPREERPGQPSFAQVMANVQDLFQNQRPQVDDTASRIRAELDAIYNRDMRVEIESISIDLAAMRITQRFDIFFGGLQGTMKFPVPPVLEVMWNAYLRTGLPQYSQTLFITLDSMLFGGLYDHVGGGFFRYVTDERWMMPHYEKMLYDNALMVDVMTTVWQHNRNELCRIRVTDTIGWMLRELKVGDAFAAGLDADSEGEEGKYYLWTEAEVDAALAGTFSAKFKQMYNISHEGNLGGGRNVPRRIRGQNSSEADESLLARQREMLLAARGKRVPPMRDDKVLPDWNGMAIHALAQAGMVFERPDWVQAAIAAFDAVVNSLGDGKRLSHYPGVTGFADDYANMIRAALMLWEVTTDARYVELADGWTETMNDHFWNEAVGGYHFTADDAEALMVRSRLVIDTQTPSANGVMLENLARLALIRHNPALGARGAELVRALGEEAGRQLVASATFINGIEFMANNLQIVVIGPKSNSRTQELLRTVWTRSLPNRLVWQVESPDELPEGHAVKTKALKDGAPTVYITQRGLVSEPFTSPVALSQFLTLPTQPVQAEPRQAVH